MAKKSVRGIKLSVQSALTGHTPKGVWVAARPSLAGSFVFLDLDMNVIAGILIGIVNDSWGARLIAPLGWGVTWCVVQIVHGKPKEYVENVEKRGIQLRWGMSPRQAFYFTEYFTATTTALTFSVLSGFIKDLI